jgi:hypothetical protein
VTKFRLTLSGADSPAVRSLTDAGLGVQDGATNAQTGEVVWGALVVDVRANEVDIAVERVKDALPANGHYTLEQVRIVPD